jgi:hypothetical protein
MRAVKGELQHPSKLLQAAAAKSMIRTNRRCESPACELRCHTPDPARPERNTRLTQQTDFPFRRLLGLAYD